MHFLKRILIFLAFVLLIRGLAAKETDKHGAKCSTRALSRLNCDLSKGTYKVSLTFDRITISNGVWKSVLDLPIKEPGTRWERVELRELGGHWLVEFEFLTSAKGEAEIQDLVWIVYELNGVEWTGRIREVVQKRRPELEKQNMQNDNRESFGLGKTKDGSIEWWVGRQRGVF